MVVKHDLLHYGKRIGGAYENRMLKKIFGLTGDEKEQKGRKLHSEERKGLYSPNITSVDKSGRMRWAGHAARIGERRV
jgi:hypothetical protein